MPTDTPSPRSVADDMGREKTPEIPRPKDRSSKRELIDTDDKPRSERSSRRHRDDDDRRREHRSSRDDETEEERAERRRKRKEREERERERGRDSDDGRERKKHRSSRRDRSRSRESKTSHHTHKSSKVVDQDMERSDSRDRERERERERDRDRYAREREMEDERRRRDDRGGDRYRGGGDRYEPRSYPRRDPELGAAPMRGYASPPRRRRQSPVYEPLPPDHPSRRRSPDRRGPPPEKDEAAALLDEIDSETRSVFVSQLAAALTSRDLGLFFEDKLGKGSVRDSRVVTDRVSRRSKGIAYVELDSVELVQQALALSGTIVMGLPIRVALTESERNNQPSTTMSAMMHGAPASGPGSLPPMANRPGPGIPIISLGPVLPNGQPRDGNPDAAIPYHRLYVGNLYYNLTADDLRQVFEPFGELAFVDLPMEPGTSRSRGYAFVQFKDLAPAEMALQSMNGFELASRPIKVSTVTEKSSGAIGIPRMSLPGMPGAVEPLEEGNGGYGNKMDATARQQLMFKLARQPDPNASIVQNANLIQAKLPALPVQQTEYVQVTNMFNPDDEDEVNWDKDLQEDVKEEVEAKYGKLVKIFVDKQSSEGHVWMKFVDTTGAATAVKGLNGRFFGGRTLKANFISKVIYEAHAAS